MNIKDLGLGIGIGAIVGSIVTFFITKHVLTKDFDTRSSDIARYFRDKETESKQDVQPEPSVAEPVKEDVPPKEEIMTDNRTDIHLITVDDYGKNGYPIQGIYIYTDGVITLGDDQKITINEAYDILGENNFRDLAITDEPAIYIRNPITGYDYRVEQLSQDYYDDNMDDTD